MHTITERLERLPKQIGPRHSVNFFIMGLHKPVKKGAVHGFGIIIERGDNGKAIYIGGASDTTDTTHYRACLAGVLTSLEWAQVNCDFETRKLLYSSQEAIYCHLPQSIEKRVAKPKRPNHDLLVKIYEMLKSVPRVSFNRVVADDQRYRKAEELADAAATRRAASCITGLEPGTLELDVF
jgi:ribonuclease HI